MAKDQKGHGSDGRDPSARFASPEKGYDRWKHLTSHLHSEIKAGRGDHDSLTKSAMKTVGAPAHMTTAALQELKAASVVAPRTKGKDLKVSWHPAETKVRSTTTNRKY